MAEQRYEKTSLETRRQERVYCGCGAVNHLEGLGPDGHCPKCGYADDQMSRDEWLKANER